MRHFDELHPVVLGIYFLSVIMPVMFTVSASMALAAFAAGIFYEWYVMRKFPYAHILTGISLTIVMGVCNCIFSHDGTTELFFVNGRAITSEALCYGAVTGIMLSSVIVWFGIFSCIMTSDKIMLLFRKMPRTALVISMVLKFVPQYVRRYHEVDEAQKVNGFSKDTGKSGILKKLSAVFTWALENSMQTADSIIRRGGEKCCIVRKKHFNMRDIIVLMAILIPLPLLAGNTVLKMLCEILLGLIPLMWEGKEQLKWRLYASKK